MKNITFEEAKEIIKKISPKYNRVTTYKKCYVFYYDDESGVIRDGGYGAPKGVVIETGEVMTMARLVARGIVNHKEKIAEGQKIDLSK